MRTCNERKQIKLTLPYPPSANRMWRKGANGVIYSNQTAVAYKKEVWAICRQQNVEPFGMQSKLVFTMRVYRPKQMGDLDNRIKLVLDSLNRHAFYDDKQIVEIHAYRLDDKFNPRIEVEVEKIKV